MATFNSPTDVVAGSLAKSSDLNNLDAATAVAFALLPPNVNIDKGTINYAVDTGVANAYVVSLPKTPTSYTDGLQVIMKALYSNTGASTVNVDSLGIKAIKTEASEDPTAGDITAGVPMELRYSTTTGYFHMIKSSATAASQSAAQAAAASAAAALVSQNAAAVSASSASASAAAAAGVMTAHTNAYTHDNIATAFGWGNHASAGYLTSVTNIPGSSGSCTGNAATATNATNHIAAATGAEHGAVVANTANMIVRRGASGEFSAGTITANITGNVSGSSGSCTGNAATATKLAATKLIGGVAFDGSADIAVTLATNATNLVTTNWTVLESGGYLYLKYGGVSKGRLDSSGNIIVTGNVSAYGSI